MYICVYLYIIYLHIHIIWVFPKHTGKTPQIMNFNRVWNHEIKTHPFWGKWSPYFWGTTWCCCHFRGAVHVATFAGHRLSTCPWYQLWLVTWQKGRAPVFHVILCVEPTIGVPKPPQWMVIFHGSKPLSKFMIWGVYPYYFWKHPCCFRVV